MPSAAAIAWPGGGKIDFVRWSEIPERFIANALFPLHAQRVSVAPVDARADVLLAGKERDHGRAAAAVRLRLASRLTGSDLTVYSGSG